MSGSPKSSPRKKSLVPVAVLMMAAMTPLVSFANPSGGNVTGGKATISGEGSANVTINQASQRAFIEWNQFSIAKGETVKFVQPNAQSIAANKVVGVAPSEILGSLSANGRVILMNPNGIYFAKGSTIDAAGLIATTLDLDKQSFLSGGALKFTSASDLQSSVVNEGTITVSDAGLAALVAPHVKNSGLIRAQLGTAVLASGKSFAVDLYGDGLLRFAPGEGINETLVGADGQPLKAQIEQAGEIQAGSVLLTASAAREVVNQSVNLSGIVRATSVTKNADGSIRLSGSGKVVAESSSQLIANDGRVEADAATLEVAGASSASSIQLTGDHIAVLSGASLSSNGGSILVGGDWQGSNGVRQAITTTLEAGATIDAGQGGKVVLWSDITNANSLTTVAGNVRALGGRIETSGHLLELPGIVQAGVGGSWLIDPTNVTITTTSTTGTLPNDLANAGVTNIKATDIQTAVNAGSTVNIVATGTITQSSALTFAPASGATGGLTLDTRTGTSTSKITLAGITNTGAGTVNVSAYSAGVIATTAGITSSSGRINLILQSFNASNIAVMGTTANVLVGGAITTRGGYVILDGTGGTISGSSLSRGSIAHGTVYANNSFTINTTTSGLTTSTTGGDFSAAASSSIASSAAFGSNVVTYNIGGKFSVNVATSAAAGYGFVTSSYLTTSPITAYDDLSITATSTATALSVANLHVSSALISTTGSVTLSNTSTGVLATNGVAALTINAAVNGATGVTITNSSAHTATASAQNGINGSGAITSSNGAISITSTTNSTATPLNYTGALSAKTGITVNATGATGTSIANLGAITLSGVGSNLSVTANNTAAGSANGIVTSGAISLANGSGLSLVSNNIINQTGAISTAANVNGTASNFVFDTTTGSNASAITTGNFTFITGSTSDVNLTIKSKGSALNPGTVGTSAIPLPGVLTIDNTNGSTVTATNAVGAIGLTLNGAMYANKNILLTGVSNGFNAIQTSAAVNTANGNIVVNALGSTAIAYYGSSSAGTLTSTNGSVSLTSVATTGSAINIVTGATISAKTGITLNATSTTATTVATVDVLTLTGAGSNISFTANDTAAGSNLGVDVGNINLANGSSLSLISNNKITQTGTIASAINTNGVASSILFDATTGSNASAVTIGTLTVAAATSTSDINLNVKSKGSSITVSGPLATVAIPLPGTITFDNSNGGTITQTSAVAGVGLTLTGGGIFGSKGITLTGVSNNNYAINSNQVMTSSLGAVTLTGNTISTGNLWAINATGTITGKSITVTATNNTTGALTTGGAVNLGALAILTGGTDLTVTGNNNNQTAQGVVTGAVTDSAVGGNISFRSDNNVTSGAISLVANTGTTTATVTYDVTSGNKTSAISAGTLTIGAGTNASGIDYKLLTSGAPITVGAITVPGAIVLDNTYGATSGTAASGYITLSNAATYATTTDNGIKINGALSGATGISLKGVSAGSNLIGVYATASLLAATGNIDALGISSSSSTTRGFFLNTATALITATTGNITLTGNISAGNAGLYLNTGAFSAPLGAITLTGTSNSTGAYGIYAAGSATMSAKNNVTLTGTTSGTYGISLGASVTSTAADVIISAQSGTNTGYSNTGTLNASMGVVTLSATSTSGAGLSQTGLITAKSATITGTNNSTGAAVTLSTVTMVAGGTDLLVVGNNSNTAGTGISQTGAITDNVVGGNITFRSNNNINQTGAITMIANTSGHSAELTYDVTTGNNASSIVGGNLSVTGTSTSQINYSLLASGAHLDGGTLNIPGIITLDNTYGGTSGAGGTPTSGFITATNISKAVATEGITINNSMTGAYGIVVKGVSSGSNAINTTSTLTATTGDLSISGISGTSTGFTGSGSLIATAGNVLLTGQSNSGSAIDFSGTVTANTGNVIITGNSASTGNTWGTKSSGLISAKNITITGTNNTTGTLTAGGAVYLGALTIVTGGGNILVTGNNSNQLANGIYQSAGAITDNSNGGSILFKSNNNISQNGSITLAKNISGIDSSVTYDLSTGNKTSTLVAGNITVATGSTSGIDYNVYTSGSNLNPGTVSVPGIITLDNTWGGTAGVGGIPTSGYITSANRSTLASSSDGITLNNTLTGGKGVVLRGVTGTGNYGINASSAVTATTGNITIWGLGYSSSGFFGNTNAILTANAGTIDITATTNASNGFYNTGAMSAKTITIFGETNSTSTGVVLGGTLTVVSGGTGLTVTGNNSNQTGQGISANGNVAINANGGSVLFKSNNNINHTGNITMVANTSGLSSAVTYDVSTGGKSSTIVTGNLTITAGSTSNINFNQYTAGAKIDPGAISVPGIITLDNTYGAATVGATPTSGYLKSSTLTTALVTSTDGITVNNTLSGTAGVVLRGVSFGGGAISGSSAVTSTLGTIDVTGVTTTGNGVYLTGLLSAKGITLTGTRTLSSGNNSVRQGALTVLALTADEAAAGVLGNVVITGNSFDQVGNGVYAYGNITNNANGGSVTFRSNNNIYQTGNISMVANTSGHSSAITYDVSTGNKTSSIVSTNSVIATGSTSGIDYNMYASGAVINPGYIRVPGIITLDNTFGAATASATPVSGYITAANLTTLATTSNPVVINTGNALSGDRGVTIRSAVNSGIYGFAIQLLDGITSSLGNISLTGIATSGAGIGNWVPFVSGYVAPLSAPNGNISLSGTISGTGWGVSVAGDGYGSLSAKSIDVVGNATGSSGNAVNLARMTILAGGGDLNVTGNTVTQAGTGISQTGVITINGSGSSTTFRSNNNINQNGKINVVANTSGHDSAVTYDVSRGDKASTVVINTPLTIATGSTSRIDYNMYASGAVLNAGSLPTIPGIITIDNTFGTATVGATPASGYLTTGNISLATTSSAIVINSGQPLVGQYGVVLRGATNGNTSSKAIQISDNITSSAGTVVLDGVAGSGYGVYYPSASYGLNGQSITVIGNNLSSSTIAPVYIGKLSVLAGSGNLSVTGNKTTAGGASGIIQNGNISSLSNGGSMLFASNNVITQNGTVSVAANTSGNASEITYNTTSGNKLSVINPGVISFTAGSTSDINYKNLSSGAEIIVNSALNVPGAITLDNTWLNGASGGITAANASTYGTSLNGLLVSTNLTATGGITLKGVTGSASTTYKGVSVTSGIFTASGTFTAGQDAINITGVSAGVTANQSAVSLTGTVSILNNSTNGNTSLIALGGRYYDPVIITNAATAGAIAISAIGDTAAVVTTTATTVTQNSNAGVFILSSNNGNVTPPKIINNGTGPVAIAAGAYLPVGVATGGQIVGLSGNSITSPNGNVILYSGAPTVSSNSTTATSLNTLAYLDSALGGLDFGNTLFAKAYASGNVAASSPITTAAGINTSEIFNALGSNNTATGSAIGPVIQFRFVAQANLLLSDNFSKVYGTNDPSAAYNSVATVGSLENLLNARLIRNSVKNPAFTVVNGVEYFNVVANGVQFRLPMADFMNSVTGTRSQYGTLAGEQVTPASTPYAYTLTSRHGVLMAAGVDVTLIGNSAKAPYLGLEITAAPLSLTQSAQTKTYGQTLAPVGTSAQASGVINGVTVDGVTINDVLDSFTMTSDGFAPTANIGTYSITPGTLNFSTGSASNYAVSSNTASVTVNPASLVVTAKNAVKFEGMPDTTGFLGVNYNGFANGESSSVLLSGGTTGITVSRTNNTVDAIGSYSGVLTATGPVTRGNYSITYAPGDFEIKVLPPNTLAVIADTYATYGTNGSVSALSSVVYKDNSSVLHTLTYSSGSGTATNGSYVYADGTNGNVTFSLVPSGTSLSSAGKLIVGAYTLVGSGTVSTTIPNLTNTLLVVGNLNVTQANASITATATSLVYDSKLRTQSAAMSSGFLSGDVLTISGTQATGMHVGTYASTINVTSGNANSDLQNYNLTTTNANLSITPAPLTLTGAGTVTKVYDATANATLAFGNATLSGVFDDDTVGFDATTLSAVYPNKNVGTRTLVISGGDAALTGASAGDYILTGFDAINGTITQAPLSVIGVGNTTKVYDRTTAVTLNASGAAVTGLITGDTVVFSPAALTAVFADKNVGTSKALTVTASASTLTGTDAGNYTFDNLASFTGSITAAPLTLTGVGTATKVYDGIVDAPLGLGSSSITGVLSGDSVSFSSTGLSAAFTDKNVGTLKAITLTEGATTLTGNDAGNYEITNLGAFTGTITRAAATLTGSGSVTKVYDRTTAATLGNGFYTFNGVVAGDDVTLDSTQVTATFPNKNVGTNKSLVVAADNSALSGTDAANYDLTVGSGFVGEITVAPLTLTGFGTVTKVYDATVSAPLSNGSVVLSGVISGDTVTANTSAVTATFDDKNVGSGKSLIVSNAAIILAGTDAANYSLQTETGLTGTITQAQLTLGGLSVPANKVYDGTTTATVSGTPTFVGLLGSDNVTLAGSAVGTYNTKDVATANTVSFTGLTASGTDAGNYIISTSYSLSATITPAALTMNGLTVPASKVYDGNTSAVVGGNGALAGVFGSDAVTLSGTAVGTYNSTNVVTASEVTFSGLTLGGTDATNYTFTIQSPVIASITPKTLTMSGLTTPSTKVYDGTTNATISGAGVLTGVVGSDAVSISGTVVGAFNSADVASANQVTFAGALLAGAASSNYVLTQQDPAAATITPATLTVTANADARFVGQTDAVDFNGVSYTGFVAGQDASSAGLTGTLAISRSNAPTSSAGNYAGVLVPSGLSAGNYTINNVAGNYEIVPAGQVLVKIANTSNVYGAAANYVVSSVQYVTVEGNALSTLTLGNSNGSTYTYNDAFEGSLTFTLGANGTITPAGFLSVGNYSVAGSNIAKVGTNYSGTPTIIGTLTVTPKALTTTASKVYDGTTVYTSSQISLNGALAGDTASATGSAELATASVGSSKSYDLAGLSLAGAQAANYFVDASANATNGVVATKTLTVTLLSDSKTYDGLAYTGGKGATFSGFVNGEDATTLGGSLGFGGSSQNAILAGSYAISGSGYTSSNYAITYVPSTLIVNRAALTVVATDASRAYGAANPTFTTTLTGFVNGETLATSGVTGSGTATSVANATSNVGNYAIVPSAAGYSSNNYEFTGVTNGRLTVTPATLTITANSATRQYGLSNPAFAGTVTGFVNAQTIANATTGTLAFSTPATVASNVGNYDVTGYGLTANNGNYVFVQATGNTTALSVTPASLTVTAVADSKTYDGLSYTGGNGATYSGFRNNDSTTDLVGTLAFTGTSQGAANAGSYVLTPGGLSSGNYTVSFTNGTLTINKASLTLQAADANRVYGLANPNVNATILGYVNGENATSAGVTGVSGVTTVATASSNVGNYAITATAGTLDAANYVFTNTIDGTLTITPATLTITANATTREYGLSNPTFSGTVTGFANSDTLANATTGTLSFATSATTSSNVGTYGMSAAGLTANHGNYLFVEASANGTALTVTQAALTVTAVADSKTYNGLSYTGGNGVSYSGFRNNDSSTGLTGTLSFTGNSQGAINAGAYAITPTGLSNPNYAVSFVDGTLTVNKASLTVTADNDSRVYGAVDPTFTSTISGFVNGESFSSVGVTGDASVTTTATATSNVGTYATIPTAGTLAATNYSFNTLVNGSLTITPATLTISANSATRLYGAADPSFSGTVSGFLNGETLASATTGTLLFTSAASLTSNVGSYALTGASLTAKNGNYVFVQDSANTTALSITPASLTVTAKSDSKYYDGVAYSDGAGLTYSGFLNNDTATSLSGTVNYSGTSQGATNAGSYVLTPSGLSNSNYTISYANGTLTVNPAVLTTTLVSSDKVYDGNTSATGSITLSGLVGSETLGVSATYNFNNKNVNTANTVTATAITLADGTGLATNYVLASSPTTTTANITPWAVTVTGVTAVNKVYDATTVAALSGTAIVTPLAAAGDSPVVIGSANATFADKNVDTSKDVTVSGYSLSGVGASNYSIIQPAGLKADITPATLKVTVNADAKFVTTADPTNFNGVSLSGFLGADTATDVSGSATITRTNASVNGAGNYAGVLAATGLSSQNYVMNYIPGDFTVVAADRVLVRVDNETVVYGTTPTSNIQSVQYFNGTTGLVTLNRVGTTNTFDDGVAGGNGTLTFSVVAANPLLSAGGNLSVGTYGLGVDTLSLAITGTNFSGTPVVAGTLNVTPLSVQVSGITAANKVYDRNNSATVTGGTIASLKNDAVSVSTSGVTASFVDKLADKSKSVTASGYALTGADASNYQLLQPAALSADITPLNLNVTGAKAINKAYDGTSVATINGGVITLADGEAVSLITSGVVGSFADAAVFNAKSVTAAGFAISGADATNYELIQPSGLTADITRRQLTFSNVAAASKVYDRNTTTTGSLSLVGIVGSESVSADVGTALFADKNVGDQKTVNLSGITLNGTDAGNYEIISTATATADITPLALTLINQSATSRVYDATLIATGSVALSSVIAGDTVGVTTPTARFVDKNVGTNKTVNLTGITLTGNDAGNYTVASSTSAQANITTRSLTITGVTAVDKVYNRLTDATISGGAISVLNTDIVNLDVTSATATFVDKNVGTKSVTATGYVISGTDAANYSLVQPSGVTAAITPLYLTLAGISASDKNYDGNTVAKATGTLVGVLAGDSAQVSSLTGTFSDAQIGTNKTVTITTGVLTGVDALNYDITPGLTTTASIATNDSSINNFILGPSKIPGIGGFKTLDLLDIKYPLPTTFLVDSVGAVKPGEPTILQTGEIGARPVMGYYASEEESTGESNYCYIYPKVNLGRSYYVGVLSGNAAKAAGGKSVDTLKVK